jgi:hypothetical protein
LGVQNIVEYAELLKQWLLRALIGLASRLEAIAAIYTKLHVRTERNFGEAIKI